MISARRNNDTAIAEIPPTSDNIKQYKMDGMSVALQTLPQLCICPRTTLGTVVSIIDRNKLFIDNI